MSLLFAGLVWVMGNQENGQAINFLKMNRQKISKVEKATDKSENKLIPVKKKNKH